MSDEIGPWQIEVFYDDEYIGSSPEFSVFSNQVELIIDSIQGGMGISVDIKNNGPIPALETSWELDVNPEFPCIILSDNKTFGTIEEIEVDEIYNVRMNELRGITLITIAIQVNDVIKHATAFLLGPLVLRAIEI